MRVYFCTNQMNFDILVPILAVGLWPLNRWKYFFGLHFFRFRFCFDRGKPCQNGKFLINHVFCHDYKQDMMVSFKHTMIFARYIFLIYCKWDRTIKSSWLQIRGEKLNCRVLLVYDFRFQFKIQENQTPTKLYIWPLTCVKIYGVSRTIGSDRKCTRIIWLV